MPAIQILGKSIGDRNPVYFIADIAANHDGRLDRAIELIHLAAKAGADAAKFQHFRAAKIVSGEGFEALQGKLSHQARWRKSVVQVYEGASVPWDWTESLKQACDEAGIHFFSSPYDCEAVDMLEPFVPAYKIGSGDITWPEILAHIARKGKPVLLATGASTLGDVQRAMEVILPVNRDIVLMQCNTNYTADLKNFNFLQLNVLRTFQSMYPDAVLGLSDHTPGHAAVLGAVALGARVVEKHFTDDCRREGPDHAFSLDPTAWREMVDRTRELEAALGDGNKSVQPNEQDTVIVQRRCIRAAADLAEGRVLTRNDLEVLRPAPVGGIAPYNVDKVVGQRMRRAVKKGSHLRWGDFE